MRRSHSRRQGTAPFGVGSTSAVFMAMLLGFLDLTLNTQMLGLAAAAISIPFVNPAPKNNGEKRLSVTPVPLFVRLQWQDGFPHDLDLWVKCYNLLNGQKQQEITIGYSRTSAGWLDLLRDDQGAGSYLNEERIQSNSEVSRVPPNTTCAVNVHLYHSHGGPLPVTANILVIQDKDGDNEKLLGNVKLEVRVPGQELTAIALTWDDRGNVIEDPAGSYPTVSNKLIATAK